MNFYKIIPMALVAIALAGCNDPSQDVLKQMKKIDKANSSYKADLPSQFVVKKVVYSVANLRSPFTSLAVQTIPEGGAVARDPNLKYVKINPNRPAQPLEAYPLESLMMVGTVGQGLGRSALIKTPTGDLVLVKMGHYLGQNHGRVLSIGEDSVTLTEAIADGNGGYYAKSQTMTRNTPVMASPQPQYAPPPQGMMPQQYPNQALPNMQHNQYTGQPSNMPPAPQINQSI